jgi:hypothetical protein
MVEGNRQIKQCDVCGAFSFTDECWQKAWHPAAVISEAISEAAAMTATKEAAGSINARDQIDDAFRQMNESTKKTTAAGAIIDADYDGTDEDEHTTGLDYSCRECCKSFHFVGYNPLSENNDAQRFGDICICNTCITKIK